MTIKMPLDAGTEPPKPRAVVWTIEFKVRCTNTDQAKKITEQLRAAGVELQEEKEVLIIKGNQDSAAGIAAVLSQHFPDDFFRLPPRNPVAFYFG